MTAPDDRDDDPPWFNEEEAGVDGAVSEYLAPTPSAVTAVASLELAEGEGDGDEEGGGEDDATARCLEAKTKNIAARRTRIGRGSIEAGYCEDFSARRTTPAGREGTMLGTASEGD